MYFSHRTDSIRISAWIRGPLSISVFSPGTHLLGVRVPQVPVLSYVLSGQHMLRKSNNNRRKFQIKFP